MNFDECRSRIDRYLRRADETQPRIVIVHNREDLQKFVSIYSVGDNAFLRVVDFCSTDGELSIPAVLDVLRKRKGIIFLSGITSMLKLQGKKELHAFLSAFLHFSKTDCRIVLLAYQCPDILSAADTRFARLVYDVDGITDRIPDLVFVGEGIPVPKSFTTIQGIDQIPNAIETIESDLIYVRTSKAPSDFSESLYVVRAQNDAFEVLNLLDAIAGKLRIDYGTEDEWAMLISKVSSNGSLKQTFISLFGSIEALDMFIGNWNSFDNEKKWLFFIALKLFGAPNNWCLNTAVQNATNVSNLHRSVFRCLLDENHNSVEFNKHYRQRRALLEALGSPVVEIKDYLVMANSKGPDAIYYLTDLTQLEREQIIRWLSVNGSAYSHKEVLEILSLVYHDLADYARPYSFDQPWLTSYFNEYRLEKLLNHLTPEFNAVVEKQAVDRDFLKLPPRSSLLDSIPKVGTQLYFVDAMGVEYLSFIMQKCAERNLLANVMIGQCELPSLTRCNKEFLDEFKERPYIKESKLDEIKHKGELSFDYEKEATPIHLIKELEIIEHLIAKIESDLATGTYCRAVLIADHGASRLAVIKEDDLDLEIELDVKGTNGGRVCSYTPEVAKANISCGTVDDSENWFILAGYKRFGAKYRSHGVETHGGATLEEVVIPIIEIIARPLDLEVSIVSPDAQYGYKHPAEISLLVKPDLGKICVSCDASTAQVSKAGESLYKVVFPDIRSEDDYSIDVFSGDNPIAQGLKFHARSLLGGTNSGLDSKFGKKKKNFF